MLYVKKKNIQHLEFLRAVKQWSPWNINIVIAMFWLLEFRIWILFGIWVLGFGILGPFSQKQITFI